MFYYVGEVTEDREDFTEEYTNGKYPNNGYYISDEDIDRLKNLDLRNTKINKLCSILDAAKRLEGNYDINFDENPILVELEYRTIFAYKIDIEEVLKRFSYIRTGYVSVTVMHPIMLKLGYSCVIIDNNTIPGEGLFVYKKDNRVVSCRYKFNYTLDARIKVFEYVNDSWLVMKSDNIFKATCNDTKNYKSQISIYDLYQMDWRDKLLYGQFTIFGLSGLSRTTGCYVDDYITIKEPEKPKDVKKPYVKKHKVFSRNTK